VLVNTKSTLIQADSDKERVVVSVTGARKVLNKHPLYIHIYFQAGKWTNEVAKPQVSINSNNSSIYCKHCNRKWKFATGNRK